MKPTSRLLLRRLLPVALGVIGVAWAGLELARYRVEHQTIPIFVMVYGPPRGPLAAQMKAAGITNIGTPVSYEQVANPPITVQDIAEIKGCLARDRFLPLFPDQIELRDGEVTAPYYSEAFHSERGRYTVITFSREKKRWHLAAIGEHHMTVCYVRPPTLWEKFLSYLPFVN